MKARSVFCFLAMLIISLQGFCQKKTDTVPPRYPEPIHKNVIKFNPTPMLLWSNVRNLTFSYERLVTNNQSFTFQAGYLEFPAIFSDTIARIVAITSRSKWGMNLGAEYRFYPLSRNRRPAPDGLYIGPYASYYGFHFSNGFDVLNTTIDQNAKVTGNIHIVNVGLSLGYQFIFWKRFSLDMLLFGPSFSYYSADMRFEGSLDETQIEDINDDVIAELKRRFPIISTLISGETLHRSGARAALSLGFRYSVQFGFHF
jgi:hypothetical protein